MPDTKYAHPETLVETDWLAEHSKDPNVRVFEVDVDTTSYEQGHAANAIGVNWKTDLQQQPVRDLLDKKQLEEFLSKNGVTKDTTIVVYGDNNNWFAAWFFWLLKYYGHKDAKLVNGGRAKWIAEGRPLVTERPSFQRSEYKAQRPDASVRALRDYVLEKVTATARRSSTCGRRRNTRASCSRPRTCRRRARSAAVTSPARRTCRGRRRSPRTDASRARTS